MTSLLRWPTWPDTFLAMLQAAATASVYILLRDRQEWILGGPMIWLPSVDATNVIALGLVTLACATFCLPILRTRRLLKIALLALAMMTLSSFVVIEALASNWFSKAPVGVPGTGLWLGMARLAFTLFWMNGVFCAAIATLSGAAIVATVQLIPQHAAFTRLSVAAVLGLAGLVVPVTTVYSRSYHAAGFLELVSRYDEIRPFNIRIEVELMVRGKPVSFARTIECRRAGTARDAVMAEKRELSRDYRFPSLKSFGHTFADGSGVFVITPDACERAARKEPLIPAAYKPLLGWTPDAATLDSFDLYVDGTALRRPDNAVLFTRMSAVLAGDDAIADRPDAFGALGWEYVWTTGTEYGAYFALEVPKEIWQRHARAASSLNAQTTYGFAIADSNAHDNKGWSVYSYLHADIRDVYIARNGQGIPREAVIKSGSGLQEARGAIVPLRRDGSGWRIVPEDHGIITFYRGLPTSYADVALPQQIILGDKVAVRPPGHPGQYVFDQASQTLFAISHHHFQMARPGSVFASR